jgi:hypothetical protein
MAKLASGGWDWLGVKPDDRTFVLGAPSRPSGQSLIAAGTVLGKDDVAGDFGVRVRVPRFTPSSDTWCSGEDEAREEFSRTLQSLGEPGKPALFRVELIVRRQIAEDEILVRTPSTYEGELTKRNYRERQ